MAASSLYIASLAVLLQVASSAGQTVADATRGTGDDERTSAAQRNLEEVNSLASVTPIVWARLSKDYLESHVARDVDKKKPVRDLVLGTTIRGESHTVGKTRLVLEPNDDHAVGRIEFVGMVRARVTGVNGPATFHYLSDSTFRAHKPLVVKDGRLTALPAVANAKTELTPTSLQTSLPGLRGQIVRRIATRREANSRAAANAITADHTADDIRDDMNRKVNDSMAAIQAQLEQQLANIAPQRGSGPMQVLSRSTADHIELAVFDTPDIARCAMPTFETAEECQCVVRLHHKTFARAMFNSEARETLWARLVPAEISLLTSVEASPRPSSPTVSLADWSTDGEWLVYQSGIADEATGTERVAVGVGNPPQTVLE